MTNKTDETFVPTKAKNAIFIERADKFALSLQDVIDLLRASDLTHHQMAEEFNKRGLRTPRGHFWMYKSVQNVCARIDAIRKAAADAAEATGAINTPF